MLGETIRGFHAKFQEIIHLGDQLKVPYKLIIRVELFCHDDIYIFFYNFNFFFSSSINLTIQYKVCNTL